MIISAENMTALASNASVALDLLEFGIRDESVRHGLSEGKEFCAFLELGATARKSEHFSAAGLEAGDYNSFVFSMPGGDDLQKRLPEIEKKLTALLHQLDCGEEPRPEIVDDLRSYFFTLAERLPIYEGIRERLMDDLRKSG